MILIENINVITQNKKREIIKNGAIVISGSAIKEIKILARSGTSVAHCPTSNMKLGSGTMPLEEMMEAGVNVCLGTDGACSNNH